MSTPAPSTKSSALKQFRAAAHVEKVKTQTQVFLEQGVTTTSRDNADTGEREWFVSCDPEFLEALGLLVGDAIHNTRSSLDHIYCQLVIANGQPITKSTMFPIRKDKSSYEKGRSRIRKEIGTGAAKVLDGIEPYKGGNDDLWHVHDLDITDKHKLLVPLASYVHSTLSSVVMADFTKPTEDAPYTVGTMKIYGSPPQRVNLSKNEALVRSAPIDDIASQNVEVEVRLFLDEAGLDNYPLAECLERLHSAVGSACLQLAATFDAEAAKLVAKHGVA